MAITSCQSAAMASSGAAHVLRSHAFSRFSGVFSMALRHKCKNVGLLRQTIAKSVSIEGYTSNSWWVMRSNIHCAFSSSLHSNRFKIIGI
ncbi:Uncharacterised protein [Vibrio cholerae]|nr:Uncharacterised protein [Vibrio cholerae]CSI52955.1 Uncharacterised protein [Vibrio cholerae]